MVTKFIAAVTLCFALSAAAEEPSSAAPKAHSRKAPAKPTRVKRHEQKDTDGTEAKGRFESDTILKSRYEQNGQGLEVDTD